ncbi:hypothetical protein PMAYCL1PPCAC_25712, partial [Pristionchus mayeri]
RMSPPRKKAKEDELMGPRPDSSAGSICSSLSELNVSPSRKKAKKLEILKPNSGFSWPGFISYAENEGDITPSGLFSKEVEVRGLPWKLLLKKKIGATHLEVYLLHRSYEPAPWSIDVSAQFKLKNTCEELDRVQKITKSLHNGQAKCGFEEFIPLNDLINRDKGFIDDGMFCIEVQFTISNIVGISPATDFTDPNDPRHDVALVFNGKKLYANKQILAIHSPVFNAIFGNLTNRDKKEFQLKDVDRENFHVVLNILQDPAYTIDGDLKLFE